jgi:G3E family GTPase
LTFLIPTLLINGWRGCGKSRFIHHLLQRAAIRLDAPGSAACWCVLRDAPLWGNAGSTGVPREHSGGSACPVPVQWVDVAGGCLCCSALLPLRVALVSVLRRLRQLPPASQPVLLIETSGLADPQPLLRLLGEPGIAPNVSLRACVTLLAQEQLQTPTIIAHPMFLAQCRAADWLMWSGAQGVTAEALDRTLEILISH